MKILFSVFTIIVLPIFCFAQDSIYSASLPKYKFTFSYGISAVNPEEINNHISISNTVFSSTAKTIKSVPEIAMSFSFNPWQNDKILILRAGYISVERKYQLSVPETIDSTNITGYTTGSIKETYSAYPLSIGVGLTSQDLNSQLQIEFIFGLGYISEDQSYTSSTGQRTSYTRSLYSPAYGFRFAGHTSIIIMNHVGLTLELAYRYLTFHEYEDETTTQSSNIEFSYSGISATIGISIIY